MILICMLLHFSHIFSFRLISYKINAIRLFSNESSILITFCLQNIFTGDSCICFFHGNSWFANNIWINEGNHCRGREVSSWWFWLADATSVLPTKLSRDLLAEILSWLIRQQAIQLKFLYVLFSWLFNKICSLSLYMHITSTINTKLYQFIDIKVSQLQFISDTFG